MKLTEMAPAEGAMTPDIQKKANRIFAAIKKEAVRFGKMKAELKSLGSNKAQIILEAQRYMDPMVINDVYKEMAEIIYKADPEGHIFKYNETGSGEHFVEALLTGLRPGMKPVMVEAFFPTFMWDITWKQIGSKGNKFK